MVEGETLGAPNEVVSEKSDEVLGDRNKPASTEENLPCKPSYRLKFILEGHEKAVASVKFSNCGKYLASASADKSIMLWDAINGTNLHRFIGHTHGISGKCKSNFPDSLVTCNADLAAAVRLRMVQ